MDIHIHGPPTKPRAFAMRIVWSTKRAGVAMEMAIMMATATRRCQATQQPTKMGCGD
jgi:hypothetical protein